MTAPEQVLCQRIAWLKASIAIIRMTPPLWPLCWPALFLFESELALGERLLAKPRADIEPAASAEIVDLATWRRRRDILRHRPIAAAGARG